MNRKFAMTAHNESSLRVDLRQRGNMALHAVLLAAASGVSFLLTTRLLVSDRSISRDDDLVGGLWAVVAAIFVCRHNYWESVGAAKSRLGATAISFALCLAYLLILPFSVWGMALLIGLGAVVMALAGRPEETITTTITIAVVMVVAAIAPASAWREPILRLIDTAVGAAVGLGAAWIYRAVISRKGSR